MSSGFKGLKAFRLAEEVGRLLGGMIKNPEKFLPK